MIRPPSMRFCRLAAVLLVLPAAWAQDAAAPDAPLGSSGTTVVIPSGLRGEIYHIPHNSQRLPDFDKLKPVGAIYTTSLNVEPRSFSQGFPGVTSRYEWFAIDYRGRFWIERPGDYEFSLISDDGAKLYIDDRLAIDNDGIHAVEDKEVTLTLHGGIHHIRVSYFQGPRFEVALILRVTPPGEDGRVFSTNEFKPPANPADWKFGDPNDLQEPKDSHATRGKKNKVQ